jgi:hypothetical protein
LSKALNAGLYVAHFNDGGKAIPKARWQRTAR